jgi:soluble lytic murein transglycosylase
LADSAEFESQKAGRRLSHAKELLGKHYTKSIVRASEGISNIDEFVLVWTTRALKPKFKFRAKQITKAILEESEKYGFDPVLLMAVIENESSFNPEVVGSIGEIGLMQLTPDTAKWIAEKYGLHWGGKTTLKDPVTNIRIGSAYLAYLREKFAFHSQLYLAAYNMGTSSVMRALGKQIWPKDYPTRVMQRYVKFYTRLSEETLQASYREYK